jgi:hypothetical protein
LHFGFRVKKTKLIIRERKDYFGSQGIGQRCGKGIKDPEEQTFEEWFLQGAETPQGLRETLGEEEEEGPGGEAAVGQGGEKAQVVAVIVLF